MRSVEAASKRPNEDRLAVVAQKDEPQDQPPAMEHAVSTWPALLQLSLQGGERGTRLRAISHSGPLYVQKPFYPEGNGYAHIYLLHPPGGIVSGDSLKIELKAQDSAHALLTTPGASRAYKARNATARQRQSIRLSAENRSSVEYFPMETIVHDGARLDLSTVINMQRHSCVAMWDIVCLGLPASNNLFLYGSLQQKIEIWCDGKITFVDRLLINRENRIALLRCGLHQHSVSAFFLAGPLTSDQAGSAIEAARDCIDAMGGSQQVGVTYVNTFFVARYLGASAAQAKRFFTHLWAIVRPLQLGRAPSIPRIWHT